MSDLFDKNIIVGNYNLLGVALTATMPEVTTARNHLARLYHPDKHVAAPPDVKANITTRFRKIQEAYDFIKKNYEKLQMYIQQILNFGLTSRDNPKTRASGAYNIVSSYKEDKD